MTGGEFVSKKLFIDGESGVQLLEHFTWAWAWRGPAQPSGGASTHLENILPLIGHFSAHRPPVCLPPSSCLSISSKTVAQ